jgi:hypothetical protein
MKLKLMSGSLPVLLATIIAACGGSSEDDASMPPATLDAPAAQAAGDDEPYNVEQDFGSYQLTMPAVRRWYEAQERIYQAMGDDPALVDDVDSSDIDDVNALEAHFNGIPEVRAAVAQSGLRMREYTVILGTLYYVRALDQAIQGGADRAALLANQQVDPANLEFAEQNRAELDRLQARLDSLEESTQ